MASNKTHSAAVTTDVTCIPPYTLPPHLTIETVEQLAAEFKQWPLAEKSTVTLDASRVENITTPGLQILLSLEKTLMEQGGTLTLTGRKDAFMNAFKDAGLRSMLCND